MSLLDEAMAVLIESYQNRSMPDDFTVEKIIALFDPLRVLWGLGGHGGRSNQRRLSSNRD